MLLTPKAATITSVDRGNPVSSLQAGQQLKPSREKRLVVASGSGGIGTQICTPGVQNLPQLRLVKARYQMKAVKDYGP